MRSRVTLSLCAIVALAATASAQQRAAAASAEAGTQGIHARLVIPRVPIHTAEPYDGRDYGMWAAGSDYKVGFAGDMTFIPYLGEAYPRPVSWSWRTESVRVGGTELLDAGEEPRRCHAEYRYEYRYRGFTEAYDVLHEGLEQTFVLHHRPVATGDLVVRGRIDTGLHGPSFTGRHRAVPFTDAEGTELVRYGAGTAIDADGRTVKVLTSHDNGRIALTVPGDWLREAAFPVTVDPLLTPVTLQSHPTRDYWSIDIARDDAGDRIIVAYSRDASSSSSYRDAYAVITDDTFTTGTMVWADITSAWSTEDVSVACAGTSQYYCLAVERQQNGGGLGPVGNVRVGYHLRDGGDLSFNTSMSILPATHGRHYWRPDVGGHVLGGPLQLTGNSFLLVYQTEDTGTTTFSNTSTSAIRARVLTPPGALGSEITIAQNRLIDHERPSVNQQARRHFNITNPDAMHWMVVWQSYRNSDWDVLGRLVNSNGQVLSGTWSAPGNGDADHRLAPEVAGQSGRYLVAFMKTDDPHGSLSGVGKSLIVSRVDWPAGGSPSTGPEQTLRGPFPGNEMRIGAVAHDHDTDSHWAITSWRGRIGSSDAIYTDRVGFNGLPTESRTLDVPPPDDTGVVGGVFYDGDDDSFLVCWAVNDRFPPVTPSLLRVNRFTYVPERTPRIIGPGCSGATIAWSGSQQIGSEFPSMQLLGAPPGQLALLLLGFTGQNLSLQGFGMPGCWLLVPNAGPGFLGLAVTVTSASGDAGVPMPLPEFLAPGTVYFQWFHTAPGANAAGFVATERLEVQIVK